MSKLKILMKNRCKENKALASILAELAGYDTPNIYKFYDTPKKEMKNFQGLLNIVRYLDEENEKELMSDYSKILDSNKSTARSMLEYFYLNRMFTDLKDMVESLETSGNNKSKEWAKIYRLMMEYQKGIPQFTKVEAQEFFDKVKQTTCSFVEGQIILKFLEIYMYYKRFDFKQVRDLLLGLEDKISEVEDEFMRKSFYGRLYEMLSFISLKVYMDTELARQTANKVIEINLSPRFNAYAYYIIGYSYLFENKVCSLKYLNKSIEIYKSISYETSISHIQEKIDILKFIWDRKSTDSTENYPEDLFGDDEPLSLYLEGLKKNDADILAESMVAFVERGDIFLSQLPKIELSRFGGTPRWAERLLKFYN